MKVKFKLFMLTMLALSLNTFAMEKIHGDKSILKLKTLSALSAVKNSVEPNDIPDELKEFIAEINYVLNCNSFPPSGKKILIKMIDESYDQKEDLEKANLILRTIVNHQCSIQPISDGVRNLIRLLIKKYEADVNSKQGVEVEFSLYGEPILLNAIQSCNKDLVELLLEEGANANTFALIGDEPAIILALWPLHLNLSMEEGEKEKTKERIKEILSLLIRHGADVNAKNEYGDTLLSKAVDLRSRENNRDILDIIEFLLKNKADLNVVSFLRNQPILLEAVQNNDIKLLHLLLRYNPYIDMKDNSGNTALLKALCQQNPNKDIIELLISSGADINIQNLNGKTALMIAIKYKKDFVQFLIDKGADVKIVSQSGDRSHLGNNALMEALFWIKPNDLTEIINLLIDHGIDLDHQNSDGNTALMIALNSGKYEAIKLLLEHRADVNIKNKLGETTLIIAAGSHCSNEIMQLLLDHGADINAAPNNGETALLRAILAGGKKHVEFLLQKGANVNAQYTFNSRINNGLTPLMLAIRQGRIELVDKLIQNGADINALDADGETALFAAIDMAAQNHWIQNTQKYEKYKNIVELLLKNGANVNIQNNKGETALFPAAKEGATELARLLIENNIDTTLENNEGQTALKATLSRDRQYIEDRFTDVIELLQECRREYSKLI